MTMAFPHRGEVYIADLDPVFGSEQGGNRPVLIVQNDVGNQMSSLVIVATITSQGRKRRFPVDVILIPGIGKAPLSRIQLNQLRTIDKRRLGRFIARLTAEQLLQVDEALKLSLGLVPM